jgi:hypothetical protein
VEEWMVGGVGGGCPTRVREDMDVLSCDCVNRSSRSRGATIDLRVLDEYVCCMQEGMQTSLA